MWKCENCGRENEEKICLECGAPMPDSENNTEVIENENSNEEFTKSDNTEIETTMDDVAVENEVETVETQQTENEDINAKPELSETPAKSNKKTVVLAIIIVAIIVACGAAFYYINSKNKANTEQVKISKDVTYEDIKSEMSEDEFACYLYAAKMQYLDENGLLYSSEEEQDKFLSEKNGDKTNFDIAKERAVSAALEILGQCNEAKKRGIVVTEQDEKDFSNQLEMTYTQNGGKENTKKQLDAMGVTIEGFEKFNKRYIVIDKLYKNVIENGELDVKDEEISKYIEENYIKKDFIKAKHILFSTQDVNTYEILSDEEKAAKKALAEATLAKIKSGEDFDTLMNELSEDPGLSSSPSGYIFTKGEMVVPFENASYALNENEVSEIVESDFGYHIIKRVPITLETLSETEKSDIVGKIQEDINYKLIEKWKSEYIKQLK